MAVVTDLLRLPAVQVAVVLAILAALVVPPVLRRRTWRTAGLALLVAIFGVCAPAFFFLMSGGFQPDWKGASVHGWIGAFHEGKFGLAPLVAWAIAALYTFELGAPEQRERSWKVVGIFIGATVSIVCLIQGLLTISPGPIWWGFVVPVYVVVWYAWRSVRFARTGALDPSRGLISLLASVPFWIYTVWHTRELYRALPDQPPECFVVSAAARGHVALVGPLEAVERGGHRLQVNRQLATFWQLEDLWRRRASWSHTAFRRIYDVWGYRSAALIRNPWLADAAYCALKPLELAARAIVAIARPSRP